MEPCDFLGCQNPVDKSEWAWRMCDECADEAWEIEGSNFDDLEPDASRGCPCRPENGGSGVCGCILGGPRVTS